MASWKKVIVSGSDAHLNHITASGNISTGNLDISGTFSFTDLSGSATSTGSFGVVHTAGRIGIGTNGTAAEMLEIGSGDPRIRLTDSSGGYAVIDAGGGNLDFKADEGAATGTSKIAFYIDGAAVPKLHINYQGKVGIGTQSPTQILQVEGKTLINNDLEVTGSISGSSTSTGSFGYGKINQFESVQIGTSGQDQALVVKGGDAKIWNGQTLYVNDIVSNYNANSRIGFYAGVGGVDTTLEGIVFIKGEISGTEMWKTTATHAISGSATSTGSFGALVVASGRVEGALDIYAASNAIQIYDSGNGNNYLNIHNNDIKAPSGVELNLYSHNTLALKLETDQDARFYGDVGIGKSPSSALDVIGNIVATGNISSSYTSTGSFGRIEVTANTLAIGGTEIGKTVADNITALDQQLSTTSSPTFANLTTTGDITARNYIVSSSVTYMTQSFSSGSTIFGDTQDDTHQFTGSLKVTGSINVDGDLEVTSVNPQISKFITTAAGSGDMSSIRVGGSGYYWELKANQSGGGSGATLLYNRGNPNYLRIGSQASGVSKDLELGHFTAGGTGGVSLVADGESKLMVKSTGHVGIGTTIPGTLLHVSSSNYGNALYVSGSGGNPLVGIGTTSPGAALEVIGNISGSASSTGSFGVLNLAQYNQSKGNTNNTYFGSSVGNSSAAQKNVGIGYEALSQEADSSTNVAIGYQAMREVADAGSNVAIGYQSGYQTNQDNSVFIGYTAGKLSNSFASVVIGQQAGYNLTGYYNTLIGANSGRYNTSAQHNVFIGNYSGQDITTGDGNTFIGYYASGSSVNSQNRIAIGSGSYVTADNQTVIGNSGQTEVKFGGNVTIGDASGNISGSASSTGSFGAGYIDNKLGIGTTAPTAALHIQSGDLKMFNNKDIYLYAAASADVQYLSLGYGSIRNNWGALEIHGKTAINFTNQGTNVNYTFSDGNVIVEGNISGSATSTGSFGSLVLSDKVQGDLTIGGNLIIQGDTVQQQVANLNIEDRFILLNSGSAAGDGGLIVQTEANFSGVVLGYDDSESRWGFQQGTKLSASGSVLAPDAYASAVVTSDDANYQKNGNIRVQSGEIYIYVE